MNLDVHLSCGLSRADTLFDVLGESESDRLYLVGDIIDGWKLRRTFRRNEMANFVVRWLLGTLKRETRVLYITGNHDEFLRPSCPQVLGGVALADTFVHVTVDGRRLLILNGDPFDPFTRHARWIHRLGDRAYTLALHAHAWIASLRHMLGFPYGRSVRR